MSNFTMETSILKARIMQHVADFLLKEIRYQLYLTNILNKDKISDSFTADVDSVHGTIKIESSFAPSKFLNSGTKPRNMLNLVGRTIPLKTPTGTLFRTVTWEQIITGKWKHPGIKGKHFIDIACENTKKEVPKIIKEEVRRFNEENPSR